MTTDRTATILRPEFGTGLTSVETGRYRREDADVVAAIGPGRVQLRLTLGSLDQVERDLALVVAAAQAAMDTVKRARRSGDLSVLSTVRATMEQANRRINVRHKGR
jgi:hypothetical protein